MENEKNLSKIIKNKYLENEEFIYKEIDNIERLFDCFKQNGLFIITYEAFFCGKINEIYKILSKLNISSIKLVYIPKLTELELINFYRYHNIKQGIHVNQSSFHNRQIPSIGWPFIRERFSHPMLLCFAEGSSNIIEDILNCKGNSNSKLCNDSQIRKQAINQAFSLFHSSDDNYAMIRELMVLLGKEDFDSFIKSSEAIPFSNFYLVLKEYEHLVNVHCNTSCEFIRLMNDRINYLCSGFFFENKYIKRLKYIRKALMNSDFTEKEHDIFFDLEELGIFSNRLETTITFSSLYLGEEINKNE